MIIRSKLHRISGGLVSGELITDPLLTTDTPDVHTYIRLVKYNPNIDNGIVLTFEKISTGFIRICGNIQGKSIKVGVKFGSKIFYSSIKFSKFEYNTEQFKMFIDNPPILVPSIFAFLLPNENPIAQTSGTLGMLLSVFVITGIILVLIFLYFMKRDSK